MDKSPDAFRTISEVAEWLDVPTHVLRFWESRFTQVKPVKRAGGRRYYRPADMALLGGIKKLLHEDGLTIRGVQKVLREQGVKHVAALVPAPGGDMVDAGATAPASTAPAPVGLAAPEVEDAEVIDEVAGPSDTVQDEVQPEFDIMAEDAPDQAEDEAPDPDAALRRFPFVDEDAAETPVPEEAAAPGPDDSAPQMPAVEAFVADVPEDDPEDDDTTIEVPGSFAALAFPGAAARLSAHSGSLSALYDRACALRDRIAARSAAE